MIRRGRRRHLERRDPKETEMKDQRNSIGDRAAPVDAPESSEVPDPSISKVDGGVERPEATEPAPHNNGATPYPLEAKVMAELMARGTNPTMLKTLNELDA